MSKRKQKTKVAQVYKWAYEAMRKHGKVVAFVAVPQEDGTTSRSPLPHCVRHSPTGFEIGYCGSGPADLAFSILKHWFLSYQFSNDEAEEMTMGCYQAFKRTFIAPEHSRLCVPDNVIEEWWLDFQESRENSQRAAHTEGVTV